MNPNTQLMYYSNPHSGHHLKKNELAGIIFGCQHSTIKECIFKQLFGLPAPHIQSVQNITPGMPVFLFNYNDRTLHGTFEATSTGQMYINRYAWTLEGQEITPFPAQVRVKVRMQCHPLSEDQFKPILAKNYLKHEPRHLSFELDQAQTDGLISLFSNSPIDPSVISVSLPHTAAKWGTLFRQSTAPVAYQEDCTSMATDIIMDQNFNSIANVDGEEKTRAPLGQALAKNSENGIILKPEKRWSSLFEPQPTVSPCKESYDSNSEGHSTMSEDDHPILPNATSVSGAPVAICEMTDVAEAPSLISETTCFAEAIGSGNSDLPALIDKLIQALGEIKDLQSRQTLKIQNLELELEEVNSKVRKSRFRHQESSHSESSLSPRLSEEVQIENQDVYQSILLVGGYDGSSWLKNMGCYCPFEDVMRPLAHMNSVRSYVSAVELDGELYVVGGGYNSSWYDTVESYNLNSNQWATCPSLNRKKGSVAGVSLLGKIFAIGGGDANDSFSEVEVLDLNVGRWIVTRSMYQKRFAPAAAELNGVLYVAGGFDGQEYLSSVERFDPRAYSWTKLKSMNSRRGCHTLTVLDEKLYAIGGFDGTQMTPTVEVFEPRTGSWSMSEPMRFARGGLGTVNFGEKIYAIGGMGGNSDVLDTVECYSEAEGWRLMQPKSMGKRCFSLAIAV